MTLDPIVDEVRSHRDAIAKAHAYDIDAIFAMLRKRELESCRAHVRAERHEIGPNEAAPNRPSSAGR